MTDTNGSVIGYTIVLLILFLVAFGAQHRSSATRGASIRENKRTSGRLNKRQKTCLYKRPKACLQKRPNTCSTKRRNAHRRHRHDVRTAVSAEGSSPCRQTARPLLSAHVSFAHRVDLARRLETEPTARCFSGGRQSSMVRLLQNQQVVAKHFDRSNPRHVVSFQREVDNM